MGPGGILAFSTKCSADLLNPTSRYFLVGFLPFHVFSHNDYCIFGLTYISNIILSFWRFCGVLSSKCKVRKDQCRRSLRLLALPNTLNVDASCDVSYCIRSLHNVFTYILYLWIWIQNSWLNFKFCPNQYDWWYIDWIWFVLDKKYKLSR